MSLPSLGMKSLLIQDMQQRQSQDEKNDISFYDILPEKQDVAIRPLNRFRSIHNTLHVQKMNNHSKIFQDSQEQPTKTKGQLYLQDIYKQLSPNLQEKHEHSYLQIKHKNDQTRCHLDDMDHMQLSALQYWEDKQNQRLDTQKQKHNRSINKLNQHRHSASLILDRPHSGQDHHQNETPKTMMLHLHYDLDSLIEHDTHLVIPHYDYSKEPLSKILGVRENHNKVLLDKLHLICKQANHYILKKQLLITAIQCQNNEISLKKRHLAKVIHHLHAMVALPTLQAMKVTLNFIKKISNDAQNTHQKKYEKKVIKANKHDQPLDASQLAQKQRSIDQKIAKQMVSLTQQQQRHIELLQSLQKLENKETALKEYETMMNQYLTQLEANKHNIDSLSASMDAQQEQLAQASVFRQQLLLRILKQGLDVRRTGLTWVIKELVLLGHTLQPEHLPDFLDEKAKKFLMAKSRKEIQAEELQLLQATLLDIYKDQIQGYQQQHQQIQALSSQGRAQGLSNQGILKTLVFKDYLGDNAQKKSLNQLVYHESQNRIKQIMNKKSASSFFFIDNNDTSILTPQQSDESERHSRNEMNGKILIFQDDRLVNDYATKSQFIKSYQLLSQDIQRLQQQIEKKVLKESLRLRREFKYKAYGAKYDTCIQKVLLAVLGDNKGFQRSIGNTINV